MRLGMQGTNLVCLCGMLVAIACLTAGEPAMRTAAKVHTGKVTSVAFSPDGKTLVSGSMDSTVKLWSVESAKRMATLHKVGGNVTSAAFCPDGKTLASAAFTSRESTITLLECG
jgi:WD40 repeat protein